MNTMGDLYRTLNGVGDYEKAMYWYQKGAEAGNADAMNNLAYVYMKYGDFEQGMYWYQKSAEAGNIDAMNSLGDMYYWGGEEGIPKDREMAAYWYQKAEEAEAENEKHRN